MNDPDKELLDQLTKTQELPHALLEPADFVVRGNAYVKLAKAREKERAKAEEKEKAHAEAASRYEKAAREYGAALAVDPDNEVALFNSATVHSLLGDYGEAYKSFNHAQQMKPHDTDIIVGSGMALDRLGRYDAAKERFDQALVTSPDDPKILMARGLTNRHLGLEDEAKEDVERASQAELKVSPAVHYQHAAYLADEGKHDAATTVLECAFKGEKSYLSMAQTGSFTNSAIGIPPCIKRCVVYGAKTRRPGP